MIEVVTKNLKPKTPHRFVFICQKQHLRDYSLQDRLCALADNVEVVTIEEVTEGQLSTALLARRFFDNDEPLMTANADQYIDRDINEFLERARAENLDGLIMTMKASDAKWSYAQCENNRVVKTAEKRVISNDAAVGIFYFRRGRDFARAGDQMIADNLRVNGEFYICPCYNHLIEQKQNIGIYGVGEEHNGMHGLGTPEDLEVFLNLPVSREAAR